VHIGFTQWMAIGVPAMLAFLPLAWFINTTLLFPTRIRQIEGGMEFVRGELAKLGRPARGELTTLAVFACAVLLWTCSPLLRDVEIAGVRAFATLSDTGVAIAAAIALFLLPAGNGEKLMDWATAQKLPWGVLILFGGGLALAAATEANGVAQYIGSLARGFAGWPVWAVLLAVIAIMVFMSELTSNTAQVATMLPILAALAPVLGVPPTLLLVPATIAASCAFMMPVGTPPNAIVFGTGLVRIPTMVKAGLWLNLAGILLIFALSYLVVAPALLH
jgi:sodium-dependent dicarboxylate transporter 2/3/5